MSIWNGDFEISDLRSSKYAFSVEIDCVICS